MRTLIASLLILFYLFAVSQKQYQFPEFFNTAYDLKPELAHREFVKDLDPKGNKAAAEKYIATYIYGEQYKFDNNEVYLDWDVTKYLKKIFDSIIPESKEKKNIDIFIERSFSNNAYINRFGNMYISIGMISDMRDEASLAHLIAHLYAHYLYSHEISENKFLQGENADYTSLDDYLRIEYDFSNLTRKFERQAEAFATKCMNRVGVEETPIACLKAYGFTGAIDKYGVSYLYMVDTVSLKKNENQGKKASKLPVDSISIPLKTKTNFKHFFYDSTYFCKLKKIASEENKKIAFEKCNHRSLAYMTFIDYLYDEKNVKNLYYLLESIRRSIYRDNKLKDKGFLAEDISDPKIYDYNKSILYKPDYCLYNYSQYVDLKDHRFFTSNNKPFNTYGEAFLYFANRAIVLGLNEANFSKALYYYSMDLADSTKKYLLEYQKKNGLYTGLASDILSKNRPDIPNGRTYILYDNLINYTGDDVNYYQAIKRKKFNTDIRRELLIDSNKVKLLIVNELVGNRPRELNETIKMINALFTLFNEDDIDVCKKSKLSSKQDFENKESSTKFKKSFIIYSPEFYSWFKQNNCNKVFYVYQNYDYDGYLKEQEFANKYTGYYIDVNQNRPYFKVPYRSSVKRKDSESNIRKELFSFLYE